nr:MAG TPA: hypothetical protein [Microviridae sp.]
MKKKLRDQLLAENGKKEEELNSVNLEIEERVKSKNGPFVLIRNKNNKWVITTCGALVNGTEFNTKEDAEEHLAKKEWDDILTAALIFISHVNSLTTNTQKE